MWKRIQAVTRPLLWSGVLLALAACNSDADSEASAATGNPHADVVEPTMGAAETAAIPEPRQTAASEAGQAPAVSEFLSPELHPIDPVEPGFFRLEVAGEVHGGEINGLCAWWMRTEDGENQDRFQFSSEWQAEDGRSMYLSLLRFVSHDELFWNAYHGHENDSVEVRLRDDGGHLGSFDSTAHSSMIVRRPGPGQEPRMIRGSGDMPAIRIAADAQQITAMGELTGPESDFGTPMTGPFTLAVHCAEDTD